MALSARVFSTNILSKLNFLKTAALQARINYCCGSIVNMHQDKVVPDVIPVAPSEIMQVSYNNLHVHLGNELTPTQVKAEPRVHWNTEPGAFYTLCMTDPDAPSRKDPKFREWHHWLVANIPGAASKADAPEIDKGEILSAYIGSGPPKDTGLHRYVFLAYKQPGKLTFDEPRLKNNSGDGRGGFKIAKFADKYKLGNPVSGNFYQAQWDEYVPLLYKQLGG